MSSDTTRLDHCRVRRPACDLWFQARLHRRGAFLRRVRHWCIPRNTAGSSTAVAGILLRVCARVRLDRRAARRRDPRHRLRGHRAENSARARAARPRASRRFARRVAQCRARAGNRMDTRGGGFASHAHHSTARRHPALGDPARAQPAAASQRTDPWCAREPRPAASGSRSASQRRSAVGADRTRRGRARGLTQRRTSARHRLRS